MSSVFRGVIGAESGGTVGSREVCGGVLGVDGVIGVLSIGSVMESISSGILLSSS